MIDCMLVLCIYLTGGLGPQSGAPLNYKMEEDREVSSPSHNEYGEFIGKLSLEFERDLTYLSIKHISGINTNEGDLGYNSIAGGFTARTDEGHLRIGLAFHPKFTTEHSTNNYSVIHPEFSYMRIFGNGTFVEMGKIAKMNYLMFGFTARLD